MLGVGDNIFEASDPEPIIGALEGDLEPEDVQARLFYRLARSTGNDPKDLANYLRRTREPLRPDELCAIACPVLVVLGDRDMVKTADQMIEALPSATFLSLPGVDHFATPSSFGAIDATMNFWASDQSPRRCTGSPLPRSEAQIRHHFPLLPAAVGSSSRQFRDLR